MPNISQLVSAYLTWAARVGHYSEERWQEQRRVLTHFEGAFGELSVAKLRPCQVTDWILSHPRWKSTSTCRSKFNIINRVFNWARREGRIRRNPLDGCERFPEADRRPCLPDPLLDELCAGTDQDFAILLRFLRASAMRLGEVCQMKWSDVDFERRLVRVERHKRRFKTGKPKIVYLEESAMKLLDVLGSVTGTRTAFAYPMASCLTPLRYIFVSRRGTPLTRRSVGARLRRLKKKLGIATTATCHGLRHQAATVALRNKAPLKAVSLWLGHASTAITERYYCDLEEDARFIRLAARATLTR